MQKDNPKVCIVMRNHNAFHLTSVALGSLFSMTYENFNVIVVNDGTTDDSAERCKELFPEIIVLESKKYIEYCKGLNLGIRYALDDGADYIFLVNNDTKEFSKDYLEKIISRFETDSSIGLVGSQVYNYDGKNLWSGIAKDKLGIPMETPTEGFIVKKEVFEKIGLLDEKLVRYFEDIDFIIRLRRAGYLTSSVEDVLFHHLCNGTSSKQAFIPNYYRPRNLLWFMKRYCTEKPFSWKIKKYIVYSKANFLRIKKFIVKFQLMKAMVALAAFIFGTAVGLLTKW